MIRKIALVLGLAGLVAFSQQAQAQLSFIGDGYVVLDVNNAGNTFYNLNNSNDSTNPLFDNDNSTAIAFSRTFTINQGESIRLGGEVQTFPSQPGTSAFLGYRITDLTETNGTFSELSLPFLANQGQNDKWQQLATPGGVEIGSSLAPGNYLLEVYQHGNNNGSDLFNQEGAPGNNWEARITVVPEPSTVLLVSPALLAGWFFVRRRRA